MQRFSAGIFLAFVLSIAGSAEAGVEKCVMQVGQNQGGWIAPEIILSYDPADKTVEIYDGLIDQFNKKTPIKVKLSSERANSRSFGWSIFVIDPSGQRFKVQYTATSFLDTKSLRVQGRFIGYANIYSTNGTCQPVKG